MVSYFRIFHKWRLKRKSTTGLSLISEERVTHFEQNSENLMKIGWKIRKLWHFEVSQIFKKHFLTSRYEYDKNSAMRMLDLR